MYVYVTVIISEYFTRTVQIFSSVFIYVVNVPVKSQSYNKHSSVGLVSRQWDAVDWVCALCECRLHSDRPSRSDLSRQCACPFYNSRAGFFFGKASHNPGLPAPLQPRFSCLRFLTFPKAKIAFGREEICECDGHTVHKRSQRRLTADWLAPRESDCSRLHSKASSDCLPSYLKATRSVLEIFKMAGCFPDGPHRRIQQQRSPHHKFAVSNQQQNIWSHRIKKKFKKIK
jgi:hypothetical protein